MRNLLLIVFLILANTLDAQNDSISFSHQSGFYSSPINLTLSNNSEGKIYYSLDGNYPNKIYKEEIEIKESSTLRVKRENSKQEVVKNYLLLDRKINLPVVCLTIKPGDLYDSVSGIYVKGLNAKKDPPYFGANFHKDWERTANIELIDTNGNIEFNQKVGVKIFGQFSAMLPQKSFAIYARKKYGKKKINAKVFPNLPFKKYKSIILRNSGSDFCSTHFRDAMMTSLVKDFNIEVQDYRTCVVYLNGNYWGIYHIREKINEHYLKQHTGLDKDSLSILKYRGHLQHNRRLNYKKMVRYITKTDFSVQSNLDSLSKLMDIDNYMDYNIAQVYFNNIDAGGNIRFWRPINKNGRWRWILFDTDFGFGLRKGNEEDENTVKDYLVKSNRKWPYPSWSTLIIRKLLENDSIKEVYLRKFTQHLNYTFDSTHVKNHINSFTEVMKPEIKYHFKKWRRSENIWDKQVSKVKRFGNKRPDYLYGFLKETFDKDTTYFIKVGDFKNGNLHINNRKVNDGFKGRYFSQLSYPVVAIPSIGYSFSHWKHDTTINQNQLDLELNASLELEPVFIKNKESDLKGLIFINEICKKDSVLSDYIEIYNSSDKDVDISGWILVNEEEEKFVFPSNSKIESKNFITVFRKKTKTNKTLSDAFHGLFNLNSKTKVRIYSNEEELVESISFSEIQFKKKEIAEKISSFFEKGWIASDSSSINEVNTTQKTIEGQNNITLIGSIILLGLLLLATFFFYKRKRRPRGATE